MTGDLAAHQHAMARLVVTDPAPGPASPELALLRAIGADWQALGLRAHCPLTWAALARQGQTDRVVTRFSAQPGLSQHLHVQSRQFLALAAADGDALVSAVARFERSLLDAELSPAPTGDVVIDWPTHPVAVLEELATRCGPSLRVGPPRPFPPSRISSRSWRSSRSNPGCDRS
jgi:hypothetical protein